jgi:hypothetical protein
MDAFHLTYPLFGLRIQNGFHALESTGKDGQPRMAAAVFTNPAAAQSYMAEMELSGTLHSFGDAADFWQFLNSLKPPTFDVVFDLHAAPEGHLEGDTRSVEELLEKHLPVIHAWGYPLYYITEKHGPATIQGMARGRGEVRLVCVFTDNDLAERYKATTASEGTLEPLPHAAAFAALMRSATVDGVILDPTDGEEGRMGKLCVDKETLLRKYLRSSERSS